MRMTRKTLLKKSENHHLVVNCGKEIEQYLRQFKDVEYCGKGSDKVVVKTGDIVIKFSTYFPVELTYLPYRIPGILYPLQVTRIPIEYEYYNSFIYAAHYQYIEDCRDVPVSSVDEYIEAFRKKMKSMMELEKVWRDYGIRNIDTNVWNYGFLNNKPICIDLTLGFYRKGELNI